VKSYYASKLSTNISETPEGFLICRNAAIARTGEQEYFRWELGYTDRGNEMEIIHRTPEEVFSPATIASFEGKPVTDNHPEGNQTVDSSNAGNLIKGVAINVRQGEGADNDKLMADLIIYDRWLADEIRQGKRELSCGYDSTLAENEGKQLFQTLIRGNHIAVVENGRAGSDVRIVDKKPELQRRKKTTMSKKAKKTKGLFSRISEALFTADMAPEDKAEILEEIGEALISNDEETQTVEIPVATDNEVAGSEEISLTTVMEAVNALKDELAGVKDSLVNPQASDVDPLEALEQEISEELSDSEEAANTEEDNLEDPTQVGDEDNTSTSDDDIEPTNDEAVSISSMDRNEVLNHIRVMKPIIAGIKDAGQRKALTDGLTNFARTSLNMSKSEKKDGYSSIVKARANALKNRITSTDSKNLQKIAEDLQKTYNSRNPHKTKETK